MKFLPDSFCLSAVSSSQQRHDILDFPIALSYAFWMWHWSICKNFNLSFTRGHHNLWHLLDDWPINRLLHYLLHRAYETQQGRNSYPRLQLLAFSLDPIIHVHLAFYVVSALHHYFEHVRPGVSSTSYWICADFTRHEKNSMPIPPWKTGWHSPHW